MSTFNDIKNIPDKFVTHSDKLKILLKEFEIDGVKKLVTTYKNDKSFQRKWKENWLSIAEENSGKLSLTTIGLIIGSALGGVGVAAMGGAFGMPLALVLEV